MSCSSGACSSALERHDRRREGNGMKAYVKPSCDKVELFKELTLSCKLL